jgi:hypothetical protein
VEKHFVGNIEFVDVQGAKCCIKDLAKKQNKCVNLHGSESATELQIFGLECQLTPYKRLFLTNK